MILMSSSLTDDQARSLVEQACDAQTRAYAPYSKFTVGAAVLVSDGTVVTGANVENASYGLTICAERVAATAAVAAGARELIAVAIATAGGASPCGACRQVLAEFGDPVVLLVDTAPPAAAEGPRPYVRHRLSDLLPNSFHFD